MVDVIKEPEKGKQANIIGTPALVYHSLDGDVIDEALVQVASHKVAIDL